MPSPPSELLLPEVPLQHERDGAQHLPTIEALSDEDDERLLAELEILHTREKLAEMRTLVDRADRLLTTVLACPPSLRNT